MSLWKAVNMNLKNMKIGVRLGLGFGLVLLLMLTLIAVGLTRFTRIEEATVKMLEKDWVKAEAANVINTIVRAQARRNMELFFAPDKAARENIYGHIEANKKIIVEALHTLDRLVYLPEGKAQLATVLSERTEYVASFTKVGKLIEEDKVDEARKTMMDETLPILDKLQSSVSNLAELQKRIAVASTNDIKSEIATGSKLMIVLGLGALVIAVMFAYFVARSITRPIIQAVGVAKTVASGDLTSIIKVNSRDETGQLLQALKDMNASLISVVSNVRSGTDTVSTASAQIAAGNLDLSSRTEEQASALEQTAASMEELTATVKQNADNAIQANQLATSASAVAIKGGTVVAEVVQTMDSINESAKKIADIISVIDGIAFQTNILALNAAVEAARAGEQGRGFAVVAAEVRVLAQRSAAAAREIKTLISNSVANVDVGCRLVEQAGSTMDEIVVSVRRVTDIMGEIAAASHEQTAGIGQINQAISQMDQVTQQNAALVEEAAAATASLEDKARGLAQDVAVFTISPGAVEFVHDARPARPVALNAQTPATVRPLRQKALASREASATSAVQYRQVANARPGAPDEWKEF